MTKDMYSRFLEIRQDLPYFVMNKHDLNDPDLAGEIAAAVHQSGGVVLEEWLVRPTWEKLCELSKTFDPDSKIILWQDPPQDWPQLSRGRVTVYDWWMSVRAQEFTDHMRRHPHYHHGSDHSLPYHFYIPYGSEQHERERVFRAIENFGLTQQSLYSRPPSDRKIIPVFSVQDPDPKIKHRTLEQENATIDSDQRFQHHSNFDRVHPLIIQCQSAVVLDCYCFNDEYSGCLSEKSLYPIAAGIPWIYAGNRYQREKLIKRGFRPHLPMAETAEELIHQMLWLQAVFRDPNMSRRWQEQQGKTIIHNQNSLLSLEQQIQRESRF